MCLREAGDRAWCQDVGPFDGHRWQAVKSLAKSWFDFGVSDSFNGFITYSIMVQGDFLYDAEVLKSERRPALVGSRLNIQVGYGPPYARVPDGDGILGCNGLASLPGDGVYTSPCGSTEAGWTGAVVFRPSDADQNMLNQVRSSANLLTEQRRIEYIIHLTLMYSLYIGLFFALSAVVWLMQKVVRYVQQG